MKGRRLEKIASLLQEVISEVIQKDVKNPNVGPFVSVSRVEVSADIHHAKVFLSIIATNAEKQVTLEALQSAAGFIGVQAAKKVVLRYFPQLTFKIDNSVDEHMKIEKLLGKINEERQTRSGSDDDESQG